LDWDWKGAAKGRGKEQRELSSEDMFTWATAEDVGLGLG